MSSSSAALVHPRNPLPSPISGTCLTIVLLVCTAAPSAARAADGADGPPPAEGLAMKLRFPNGRPVIWWPASE